MIALHLVLLALWMFPQAVSRVSHAHYFINVQVLLQNPVWVLFYAHVQCNAYTHPLGSIHTHAHKHTRTNTHRLCNLTLFFSRLIQSQAQMYLKLHVCHINPSESDKKNIWNYILYNKMVRQLQPARYIFKVWNVIAVLYSGTLSVVTVHLQTQRLQSLTETHEYNM